MRHCPYCDSPLRDPPRLVRNRTNPAPGRKDTGHELVHCSDCERVIDGFSAH